MDKMDKDAHDMNVGLYLLMLGLWPFLAILLRDEPSPQALCIVLLLDLWRRILLFVLDAMFSTGGERVGNICKTVIVSNSRVQKQKRISCPSA